MLALVAVFVVLALVAAGVWLVTRDDDDVSTSDSVATSSTSSTVKRSSTSVPDAGESRPKVIGAATGSDVEVVVNALSDVEDFWKRTMPDVFDEQYRPIAGGFYAASPQDPLPPCAESPEQIAGNAFYCSDQDVVAWDDTDFVPGLVAEFGELSAAVVIAHEVGHAIQARSGMSGATITLENQADCYAGSWLADVQAGNSRHFEVDPVSLDKATAGFLSLADTPGTAAEDPSAHGNAFDRVGAFQDGIANGAGQCASYTDSNLKVTELPFTEEDFAAGGDLGNLPASEILTLAPQDLENFWSLAFENAFGEPWESLAEPRPFDPATGPPSCGTSDTSGSRLFFCVDERYVGYESTLMETFVERIGDFSAATLLASQWGLAVELQAGTAPASTSGQNLQADCYAGAWAASVFKEDRLSLGGVLSLSPGDLDESVTTMLIVSSSNGVEGQGTGFDRVTAFRTGILGGVTTCGSVGT